MRSYLAIALLAVPTAFACINSESNKHYKRQADTAAPLSAITSGAPAQPTQTLRAVPTAGQAGPFAGAPALPDISGLNLANYPGVLAVPPTDSEEVRGWVAEVAASGIQIPSWGPNPSPECSGANAAAAADMSRCWWTCQGCSGEGDIETCPDKMTWGLTFDDGPSIQSPRLLNWLDTVDQKATFYLIGSNVLQYPDIARYEYVAGHELSSHTWSHSPLTTLTNEQIIAELGWTRKVIKDVTGVSPTTFRPPQGDIDNRVRAIAKAMGLTPVLWTDDSPSFDSEDWQVVAGNLNGQQAYDNFMKSIQAASTRPTGFISLEHDVHSQTVDLAFHLIPDIMALNTFDIKPVVECQNLPLSAYYAETSGDSSNNAESSSASSAASSRTTGGSATSVRSTSSTASATGSAQQGGNSASRSSYSIAAVLLSVLAGGFMLL